MFLIYGLTKFMMIDCYLMLGSNLGDKANNLREAINMLQEAIGKIEKKSSIYESEPWGFKEESFFLNQAVQVSTNLSTDDLLNKCENIERKLGRLKKSSSYESRLIDIDILFYGSLIENLTHLIIPHPRMNKRRFVLEPLNEIASDFVNPLTGKKVSEHLQECKDTSWVRLQV